MKTTLDLPADLVREMKLRAAQMGCKAEEVATQLLKEHSPDRVEIISPGHLPNNLTIANIKAGNSNIRNPILASFAAKLLPYRGLGSGLLRALKAYPAIHFIDDQEGNLFKVIVTRPAPTPASP